MGRLVSVIVVTWNSAAHLRRCLAAVRRQTHRELELVVVDNASDDTSREIAAEFQPVELIANDSNTGFSCAVNQALSVAGGDFVLLLNPDAEIGNEYVEQLTAALSGEAGSRPAFGAATGKLLQVRDGDFEPTGLVDSKGIRMTRSGRHFDIGHGKPDQELERGLVPLPGGLFEVFGVSGAAAMFRSDFVTAVSLRGRFLDEDFFAYREDADVAWRGRLFGWRAVYVPQATAFHVRRVTPDRRRRLPAAINMHSVKNRFLLRLKNQGSYLAWRNLPFEVTRDLVALAAVLTIERSSLAALSWLWRNRRHIAAKRQEIQRRRCVGDRDLARWFR